MLVKFTNTSGAPLYVSHLMMEIATDGYVETRRTVSELNADKGLKRLVLDGDIELSFTMEDEDDVNLTPPARSVTNLTRPAADAVPPYTAVWSEPDHSYIYSDGTTWYDGSGNPT